MQIARGNLYMIPCTLGNTAIETSLPPNVPAIIESLDLFIVENAKSARHFIRACCPKKVLQTLVFFELNQHTPDDDIPGFLEPALEGKNIGLISEAGCPGIADPGATVVKYAHEKKIRIIPLVGPSSILLALMASGMNGQSFCFHGYLPVDRHLRIKQLKDFEQTAHARKQSQIFMETPYRNQALLSDMFSCLHHNTHLCIAANITLENENIRTKRIGDWKREKPELSKQPVIFIIG